jgi:AraC-like DNA-binding protein
VGDSLTLLDVFVRGVGVGAVVVMALAVLAGGASRAVRATLLLLAMCIVAWLLAEGQATWPAIGAPIPLAMLASGVAGAFWLFVLTVFEDRPPTPWMWTVPGALILSGLLQGLPAPADTWLWAGRNVASGLLAAHAAAVIVQGWAGDLLEARRRLRGIVLGVAAVLAVTNTVIALVYRVWRGPWIEFSTSRPLGMSLMAAVMVAIAVTFLQPRSGVFGPGRRPAAGVDARAEAAEREMLQALEAFMADGGWRREGLTIRELAAELDIPEHRLRRVINRRLGHRNFADFLNGRRVEAAKRRLADPAEARTTVAAIAFDLGFGSLGPFNRAFKAATGATPTEWRRTALGGSPELHEAS